MAKAQAKSLTIAEVEKEEQELAARLAETKERAKGLLNQRREELIAQREKAKAAYEESDLQLLSELTSIEEKLGLTREKLKVKAYNIVGNSKPKDIEMSDEEWHKMIVAPIGIRMKSLDNYILLALHNVGEKELHAKVIAAACLALGHETKSDNVQPAVAGALNRLKGDGQVASATRGHYQITKKGHKRISDMISQALSLTNDVEGCILKTITKASGPINNNALITGMLSNGYQPKNAAASKDEVKLAIESLKSKKKITTRKEGNSTIFEIV